MRIHRLLVGYECERELPGMEAQPASDVVRVNESYREEFAQQAIDTGHRLMQSLEGEIRCGADPEPSRQLRAQLGRWLKKRRGECKSQPGVV